MSLLANAPYMPTVGICPSLFAQAPTRLFSLIVTRELPTRNVKLPKAAFLISVAACARQGDYARLTRSFICDRRTANANFFVN